MALNVQRKTTATRLTAEQLIEKMGIAMAEVYSLGAEIGDEQITMFEEAVPLIEKAWDLEDGIAYQALETARERMATDTSPPDEDAPKLLLGKAEPAQVMSIIWLLVETITNAAEREDREKLSELLGYLLDFWNLEAHLKF